MPHVFTTRETVQGAHVHVDVFVGPNLGHLVNAGRLVLHPDEAAALRSRLVGDQAADERAAIAEQLEQAADKIVRVPPGPQILIRYEAALVAALAEIARWLRTGERSRPALGFASPEKPR